MSTLSGYIYVMTNRHMPGLVKIGFTERDPKARASELSNHTGVPGRFEIHASWEVENAPAIEKRLFSALAHSRATGEFFNYNSPEECTTVIVDLLKSWGELDTDGLSVPSRVRAQRRLEEETQAKQEHEKCKARALAEWRKIEDSVKRQAFDKADTPVYDSLTPVSAMNRSRFKEIEEEIAELKEKSARGSVGRVSRFLFGTYEEQLQKAEKEKKILWRSVALGLLREMYKHFAKFAMNPPEEVCPIKHSAQPFRNADGMDIDIPWEVKTEELRKFGDASVWPHRLL